MKDKPLGFQIWIAMSFFILIISMSVSVTTLLLIQINTGARINFFSKDILSNLFRLLVSIGIFNVIFAKMIANRITEPIRYLEKRVRHIAQKDWSKPVFLKRKDEIGKLAYSIGIMQENLKRIDKEEEIFLQTISHDLKTPVMVIRSYCQAVQDGMYLDGSLDKTVSIIEKEAEKLQGKIEKLLCLNSLEYTLKKNQSFDRIDVLALMKRVVQRFSFQRKDISILLNCDDFSFYGIEEKIELAIDNIIDNSIRYAKTLIDINVEQINEFDGETGKFIIISIANDGEELEENKLEALFNRFYKGSKGNFGLGLYIAHKIIEFHSGHIWAENKDQKVCFNMVFPILPKL